VGHIARGVMVEKASLNKCFDFCVKDHDFLLISNIQDGRARSTQRLATRFGPTLDFLVEKYRLTFFFASNLLRSSRKLKCFAKIKENRQ
jgi:hypothetical protein